MKFRKKPIVIEAFTFEEVIEAGRETATATIEDHPAAFLFRGIQLSYAGNHTYSLVTPDGMVDFTPDDVLMVSPEGVVYPCSKDAFDLEYVKAGNSPLTDAIVPQAPA